MSTFGIRGTLSRIPSVTSAPSDVCVLAAGSLCSVYAVIGAQLYKSVCTYRVLKLDDGVSL